MEDFVYALHNKPRPRDHKPGNHFLWYPLDYVYPIFIRWYKSDFTALPADGGWDAQDQQLMDDLYTLLAKVNDVDARVSKRLEREAEAQTKRPKRGRQTRIPSFDEVFES